VEKISDKNNGENESLIVHSIQMIWG